MQGSSIVTKNLLKTISGEFELATIRSLDLSKRELTDLGCLGDCDILHTLNLSRNSIATLYCLASLSHLTNLDLSYNQIESLEGLQTLEKLRVLNLAGNLLQTVEVLWNISNLNQLWSLTLLTKQASNPLFQKCTNYKQAVTSILPGLNILDGECIMGKNGVVFASYEEMEAEICDVEKYSNYENREFNSADDWIPEDFWRSTPTEEAHSLEDLNAKMTDLLRSCHTLSKKGKDLLASSATPTTLQSVNDKN